MCLHGIQVRVPIPCLRSAITSNRRKETLGNGWIVLRGIYRRASVQTPARTHGDGGGQRAVHHHDDEPAAAAPGRGVCRSDGIRPAAGEQPVDAGDCRGAVGGRYDAGHDGGQSGVRQDRIPEAGVSRRYAVRRDGNHGQAGITIAPRHRGGVFRAPRHQSARGTGGAHSPGGVDAQEASVRIRAPETV